MSTNQETRAEVAMAGPTTVAGVASQRKRGRPSGTTKAVMAERRRLEAGRRRPESLSTVVEVRKRFT